MSNTDLHKTSSIDQCKIIDFGKHHHPNGNLSVAENRDLVPFDIKRVFYIYDVPGGEERGGHSHKSLQQVIIAISGAFDVLLDDGVNQRNVTLNRPYLGLLVTPGVWSKEHNFSSGSVCLVLASDHYDESDYVRNYDEFKLLTSNKTSE
ncbi:MAG: WxcM-like domain-containing protein [Muribaculaceae bacterium]|nr:WxcM-like domain-containing protein [Muribaculaceae bacterium]